MAFVAEDGIGLADANSYPTVAQFKAYCDDRGISYAGKTDDQIQYALINGSAFIDTYRGRFPGYRLNWREQGMEWPRYDAYDRDGYLIPSDEIPMEIIRASCEAARLELASAGALTPTITAGIRRKRVRAGSVETETEYAAGGLTAAVQTYSAIEGILAGLLGSRSYFTGTAVRV